MFPKSMKFPVFAAPLLLLMVWAPQALAGKMTLAWEVTTTHTEPAHSPATALAGYHLYYWQGSGTQKFVDLGKEITSYTFPDTFTDLVEGQIYSFAVTAYDTADKESSKSNIITAQSSRRPIAINNVATTPIETAVTIAVLDNDSDPDGNPLTITSIVAWIGSTNGIFALLSRRHVSAATARNAARSGNTRPRYAAQGKVSRWSAIT
jgi:hypothetical protein